MKVWVSTIEMAKTEVLWNQFVNGIGRFGSLVKNDY